MLLASLVEPRMASVLGMVFASDKPTSYLMCEFANALRARVRVFAHEQARIIASLENCGD